jgi:hypothetical protein
VGSRLLAKHKLAGSPPGHPLSRTWPPPRRCAGPAGSPSAGREAAGRGQGAGTVAEASLVLALFFLRAMKGQDGKGTKPR